MLFPSNSSMGARNMLCFLVQILDIIFAYPEILSNVFYIFRKIGSAKSSLNHEKKILILSRYGKFVQQEGWRGGGWTYSVQGWSLVFFFISTSEAF